MDQGMENGVCGEARGEGIYKHQEFGNLFSKLEHGRNLGANGGRACERPYAMWWTVVVIEASSS